MQTIKPLNLKLNLIKGTLSIKVSIKQQKYKIFNVYYNSNNTFLASFEGINLLINIVQCIYQMLIVSKQARH